MKADLKRGLQEAFVAPAPTQKKEFLKTIRRPEISTFSFMLSQAGYIPRYVWGVSAATFAAALAGGYFLERDVLWAVSALVPFVALSALTGNARSGLYGMEELEMAARFSLKSVTLARLGILGATHFILLLFLAPVCAISSTATIFGTGIYLLAPYMLTAFLGLWASRKMNGLEASYMCMGIAACVSAANTFSRHIFPAVYEAEYTPGWGVGLMVVMMLAARELKMKIRQTEELTWSLS